MPAADFYSKRMAFKPLTDNVTLLYVLIAITQESHHWIANADFLTYKVSFFQNNCKIKNH